MRMPLTDHFSPVNKRPSPPVVGYFGFFAGETATISDLIPEHYGLGYF